VRALSQSRRKRTEDLSGRDEPFLRPSIVIPRSNELWDVILFVENGENVAGRAAVFEPGSELMCEKVVLGFLSVLIQSSIENGSEMGRGSRGRRERSLRHWADALGIDWK
jgi:hypothetical protein